MLDLLVQLLSMNSYVKLSIWLQFSKVWFEDYTQWIVLALWTVSENIFPPSQLIYLSEVSVNLLKSCFCYLVPKEIIRVPMLFGLWLQFCFLKLRIRGHLSRAHYRDIAKKSCDLTIHRASFEFFNFLHSWYKHFKNHKG